MSQYGSPNEILAEFEAGPQSLFAPRRLFYVRYSVGTPARDEETEDGVPRRLVASMHRL